MTLRLDPREPRRTVPRILGIALLGAAFGVAAAATAHDGRVHGSPRMPPNAEAAAGDGFERLMDEAMARMHVDMHVPYSGDPDRDFARMMIPHHQGAIDMALLQLRYGKDEKLKRLAQEIIIEQREEIAVMHAALTDLAARDAAASRSEAGALAGPAPASGAAVHRH